MLCYPRIPVEILKELIRSYPASVGMQDYFGNTPVHVYLKSLPPLTSNDVRAFVPTAAEVVNVFLNEYPKICTIKDKDGFTILHLFCKNALLEESVIRKMIETNPVALTSRTKASFYLSTKHQLANKEGTSLIMMVFHSYRWAAEWMKRRCQSAK